MKEFIHHKAQEVSKLIDSYNDIQQLYISSAFEFDDKYSDLLKNCREFMESNGTNTQVAEVLNILSMFETARKGINPFELKKVSTGRRELKMMVAHHGLGRLFDLLNSFYKGESDKLQEAEDILANLIISLYQSGVLDDSKINDLSSIEKIEAFWRELLSLNGSMTIIDKKLRFKIIAEDIYLIIEKLLMKIK